MTRLVAALVLLLTACDSVTDPEATMAMQLISPAFADGETIPVRHTCDGDDRSPVLEIRGVPADAAALLLVMDDPDAPGGTFDHWVLADLPPDTTRLPEGVDGVGTPGRNGFGRLGYGGPCPPVGAEHRYVFTLLAVSEPLGLAEGASKDEALAAADGRVVAEATLTGRYRR